MRWTTACAGCGQVVSLNDQHQARAVHCPVCGHALPAEAPAAARPSRLLAALRRVGWRRLALAGAVAVTAALAALAVARARRPRFPLMAGAPAPRGPSVGMSSGVPVPAGGGPGAPPPAGEAGPPLGMAPRIGRIAGAALESMLPVAPDADHPLPSEGGAALPAAGRLGPCLAVAFDPSAKRLITATPGGELRWFAADDLRPLGGCRLPQPAYQLLVAPGSRVLVAALSRPESLYVGPLGDRDGAGGDLYSYDLDALYQAAAGQPPRPRHRLALDGYVTGLAVSPATGEAYYCVETATRGHHVGELSVADLTARRKFELRFGGSTALALAPGAAELYVLNSGRLVVLDLKAWKERATFVVGGACYALAAGRGAVVYLAERRGGVFQLTAVDAARGETVGRWASELEGRAYLQTAPAADRLYLGTSAVLAGQLLALDVTGKVPALRASAGGDRRRLLRGPVFLTTDGRWLITSSGLAFRADGGG